MKLFLKAIDNTKKFALQDEKGNIFPGQISTNVVSEMGKPRYVEVKFLALNDGRGVTIIDDGK